MKNYLKRFVSTYSHISTIVFRGNPTLLEQIYYPLSLIPYETEVKKSNPRGIIEIDDKSTLFLSGHPRICIFDDAGMGKTTLVRYHALQCWKIQRYIPIIVELRNVKDKPLKQYILGLLRDGENGNDIEEFEFHELMNSGNVVIYYDGFDEVQDKYRENIILEIKEMVLNSKNASFFLTSRHEKALTSLPDFSFYQIKSLSEDDSFKLMVLYEKHRSKLNHEGERDIPKQIMDAMKHADRTLKEFLVNPLLVSLLYLTYGVKHIIPEKKFMFYENVYNVIYREHDIALKDGFEHAKKSDLDIDDFKKVLSGVGFLSVKSSLYEYKTGELKEYISESTDYFKISKGNATPDNILNDMSTNVPFLKNEGGTYRWIHLSFAEYFAACFISECTDKEKTIGSICNKNIHKFSLVFSFLQDKNPLLVDHLLMTVLDKTVKELDKVCDFVTPTGIPCTIVGLDIFEPCKMLSYWFHIEDIYIGVERSQPTLISIEKKKAMIDHDIKTTSNKIAINDLTLLSCLYCDDNRIFEYVVINVNNIKERHNMIIREVERRKNNCSFS